MTISKTEAMIIQTVIEAAILRALRDMDGRTEDQKREMLAREKSRNAELISEIKAH